MDGSRNGLTVTGLGLKLMFSSKGNLKGSVAKGVGWSDKGHHMTRSEWLGTTVQYLTRSWLKRDFTGVHLHLWGG